MLLKTLEQAEDAYQLREAARAVGELGESRAVTPLLALLAKSQTSLVREQVLLSLGKLAHTEALPALGQYLKFDEDEAVRAAAVAALANYPAGQSLPWLLSALQDKSFVVRQRVAQTLGKVESEEVLPGLAEWLNDPVVQVRSLATEALLKTGRVTALGILERFLRQTPFEEGWMVALRIIESDQQARPGITQTNAPSLDYPTVALAILRERTYAKE